jgi:hypothetical protein
MAATNRLALNLRVRANWHLASPTQSRDDCALSGEGHARPRIVDRLDNDANACVVLTDLDGDDALTRRRNAGLRRQGRRYAMQVIQTAQAGRSQDQRIIVARVELAQPRIEIPTNGMETGAVEQTGELRDSPDAAGPDAGRGPQDGLDLQQGRGQATARKHHRVTRVLARRPR